MSALAAVMVPWSPVDSAPPVERPVDLESRQWLRSLRAKGREHDESVARLHELLLRAARFEGAGRRPTTRACRCSRGWTPSEALAGSRPGPTSSRCSRLP